MIAQSKPKPINNEYVHNYSVPDLHNYCFFFLFSEASVNIAAVSFVSETAERTFPLKVHTHEWE